MHGYTQSSKWPCRNRRIEPEDGGSKGQGVWAISFFFVSSSVNIFFGSHYCSSVIPYHLMPVRLDATTKSTAFEIFNWKIHPKWNLVYFEWFGTCARFSGFLADHPRNAVEVFPTNSDGPKRFNEICVYLGCNPYTPGAHIGCDKAAFCVWSHHYRATFDSIFDCN